MEMTFRIGDWVFSPKRLILWHSNMPQDEVLTLVEKIDEISGLQKAKETLFSYDWRQVLINPFQINRIGICVAKNCNLRCRYCSECSTEGMGEEIPNEHILSYVSDLMIKKVANSLITGDNSPVKVIFTGGGEPTYDFEKFSQLVVSIEELANRNNMPLYLDITTNGAYDLKRIDFICQHFQSIMVSYDGMPSIQNYNRPSPYYALTSPMVESSIKRILDNGVPLIIRSTIAASDVGKMKEMADFLFGKFGINYKWSIFPVTPKGRARNFRGNVNDSPDFFSEFFSMKEYAQKKYGDVQISSPLFFSNENDFYCGSLGFLTRVAWLRATGEIVTCLEMDKDQTVIGTLTGNQVVYKDICEDPLVKITQEKFHECENCIAFPFCRGGCPADHRANRIAGEMNVSWACQQTIKYCQYFLEKIVSGEQGLGWKLSEIPLEVNYSKPVYRLVKEET